MIFQRIEVHNLFSYRQGVFDLSGATSERNIALIFGRNGYGKTSLLNAIKLLFVGPNADLGRAVQRGRELSPKQYVMGWGEEWLGIMNRQARRQGEQDCAIRIHWDDPDGPVEAVRRWTISRDGYEETVELDVLGEHQRHLRGADAQAYLGERLPEDYLPYFFYDGEQIQQLAEAARTDQIKQMERILNISKLETLLDYLEKVARGWRNNAAEASARSHLCQLEREHAELDTQRAASVEKSQRLERERGDLERRVQDEDRFLEDRRASVGDELLLKREREELDAELETRQGELVHNFIPVAPLLVNPAPVRGAVSALEKIVHSEIGTQAVALKEVLAHLPNDLFDKPPQSSPPLTESQRRFYRARLDALLRAFIPSPEDFLDGPLRLDAGQARELLALFQHYDQAVQERADRIDDLRTITRTKRRLAEIRERLEDLSGLDAEEQQDLRRRKAANDERKERLGAIKAELSLIAKEQQDLDRKIEAKQKQIRDQERQVHLSVQAQRKVERAEQAHDFFLSYKEALRANKRDALEAAINRRFAQLMTSHGLIDRIRVDEHFRLHFIDRDNEPIAMGSLSAGMKQIMATALLWGLKEVSGKSVPLVIDTPLARIDRAHQDNLLRQYYPHAGRQVIILPTDAELDADKHAMLAPHIYREYRLENPNGDRTQIVPESMYPPGRGASHG